MGIFFNDRSFEYETIRTLSYSNSQGATFGEVVEICKNIEAGNFSSWYDSWSRMAFDICNYADNLKNSKHYQSASEFYLRASNYFRNSEFFLRDYETKRLKCYQKSVDAFREAMSLSDSHCEAVKISYEDYYMNGYLYFYDVNLPTLISIGGYDSTAEELYFSGGRAAIERGYNLLIFDGPGQGGVLRIQKKWQGMISKEQLLQL